MPAGRPSEYKDEYVAKVYEYLSQYKELGEVVPTKEGFAIFIGSTRPSILKWASEHPEFLYALENIESYQGKDLQNNGLSGKYNPTIAKLMLSANHGMREKTETDITSNGKELKAITGMVIAKDE
jgi:hypothetical protein